MLEEKAKLLKFDFLKSFLNINWSSIKNGIFDYS